MTDRYDVREAREAWQRLLWRATESKRLPTAESDRLALWSVSVVDPAGERILLEALASAWSQGWQPAELVHVMAHKADRIAARLVDLTIVADHDRRTSQVIDPRWQAQIDGLEGRSESTRHDWLRQWRRREGMDRRRCYDAVGAAWRVLSRLPRLPLLIPPPGVDPSVVTVGAPALAAAADPLLERIRKLLAKAESTAFEAEAELLTAKAQELMARHAVDRARLERGPAGDEPCMTRVLLEAPYVAVKGVLLAAVAEANRCRAIGINGLDLSVVVGHADDLAAVEVLFTSLLVQAGNALAEAARSAAAGDRSRTSAFRRSFHLGFASRIGERLATANDAVLAEAGAVASLPVLRSRSRAVDDAVERLFGGRVTESRIGGRHDAWGAAQGRSAADLARLNAGELTA
ncbi:MULTISPECIES: DUF2786 domain-containing protein [unclassified Nocardioides]|uniref:DUF2786 domain-containing protein n=1 Tax=unclassified Nocardioides TaxID=2615069 RepID=UPI0006F4E42D|nr:MULTISPECIES: DUF2786 domain-containing protein [unclassified Nocardioides]KRA38461.1 hypothetical protein ASD81_07495 [Nocardioides sp. Root614]KRA92421.1 hypothetical protein ASD84_07760 [Nocardioides sp. Root682]